MNCTHHPQTSAADRCQGCAEAYCSDCLIEIQGETYCRDCKYIAVKGPPLLISGPRETASDATTALKYAIFGIFCLGFILGPMAIFKGIEAKRLIREDPSFKGLGMANVAIAIGIFSLVAWLSNLIARF